MPSVFIDNLQIKIFMWLGITWSTLGQLGLTQASREGHTKILSGHSVSSWSMALGAVYIRRFCCYKVIPKATKIIDSKFILFTLLEV